MRIGRTIGYALVVIAALLAFPNADSEMVALWLGVATAGGLLVTLRAKREADRLAAGDGFLAGYVTDALVRIFGPAVQRRFGCPSN